MQQPDQKELFEVLEKQKEEPASGRSYIQNCITDRRFFIKCNLCEF